MPANQAERNEALVDVLLKRKLELYDDTTNELYGPSQDCWKQIAKDMELIAKEKGDENYKIQPKNVYTIVKMNRHDIKTKVGLEVNPKSQSSKSSKQENEVDDDWLQKQYIDPYINHTHEEDKFLNFEIKIASKQWEEIYTTAEYNRKDRRNFDRSYDVLKKFEWTHPIQSEFYRITRLPCAISFKRSRIYTSENIFLNISGSCKCCGSNFYGVIFEKPSSDCDSVKISCTYSGEFKQCSGHQKLRLLSKEKRAELIEKMTIQNIAPSALQKMEAAKIMDYGDAEPPLIPSNGALRTMKWKHSRDTELHERPILALSVLKGISPYNSIIHDIGFDKFFLHYWSVSEINNYRLYCRENSVSTVSIDATGGVVRKTELPSNRKMGALFLYEIVVRDQKNSCQFSVSHMISEKHDNNSIAYWISEWLRNDIIPPRIVVTDMSLALMMGVIKSCTQYSTLNKYLDICDALLQGRANVDVPTSMLRCDFAHLMHLISTWPEIKNSPRRAKEFYMHCIALIVGCQDYSEIKHLLRYIFTAVLHEEDGRNKMGEETACEKAKLLLKRKIAGFSDKLCIEEEYSDNDHLNDLDVDAFDSSYFFLTEIQQIYKKCEEEATLETNEGKGDNMHFNPAVGKKLLNLCRLLPIWSAIMVPYFGYGNATESSSSVEGNFNNLKNRVFQHKNLPIRVDDFVKIHIDSILGSMNLIKARSYKENKDEKKNDPEKTEDIDVKAIKKNHAIENWGGEAVPPLKKPRKNYLTPNTSILRVNDHSRSSSKVVGILKNGNCLTLKSVKIGEYYYNVLHTCAFDSITQILFTTYSDCLNYQKFVDRNKTRFKLFELVANGLRDGITVQTYRKRAMILENIFTPTADSLPNVRRISATTTVENLINKLFKISPTVQTSEKCQFCDHFQIIKTPIIILYFQSRAMEDFNEQLHNELFGSKKKCKNCGKEIIKEQRLTKHFYIEPTHHLHLGNAKDFQNFGCLLSSVPLEFEIGKRKYFLRGVVSFLPGATRKLSEIGHYIAYCYRQNTGVWERYDDMNSTAATEVRPSTELEACQLLMYTV